MSDHDTDQTSSKKGTKSDPPNKFDKRAEALRRNLRRRKGDSQKKTKHNPTDKKDD